MKQFRLTPDAKESLISIARYTEKSWGKQQRNTYIKMLDNCFQTLADEPKQGRLRTEIDAGLYSFLIGKHVVFYMIKPTLIIIVNILHERMDYIQHIDKNT